MVRFQLMALVQFLSSHLLLLQIDTQALIVNAVCKIYKLSMNKSHNLSFNSIWIGF